ncbi:MAG: hypothetical protein Q8934_09000 [Bacillota bacterium]|nr:hypothetical protein [Bacillota bacterium]
MNFFSRDTLKKFGLSILFILLSFLFYYFNSSSDHSNKETIHKPKQIQESFENESKPETFIPTDQINDYVMKAFLQELIGTDYTLLVNLFSSEMLDKNINTMNDDQLQNYAQEIGKKIKNNKDLVVSRILSVSSLKDGGKVYQIEMEFRDGTKKIIQITTKNGKIITPIRDLF